MKKAYRYTFALLAAMATGAVISSCDSEFEAVGKVSSAEELVTVYCRDIEFGFDGNPVSAEDAVIEISFDSDYYSYNNRLYFKVDTPEWFNANGGDYDYSHPDSEFKYTNYDCSLELVCDPNYSPEPRTATVTITITNVKDPYIAEGVTIPQYTMQKSFTVTQAGRAASNF